MFQRLCVFCGSSSGSSPAYAHAAHAVGQLLAHRGIELVYGGGNVGLMGIMADACLQHGGRVIGVIPQGLVDREVAHAGLTELRIVATMHERKALMADLAGAFLALPGGYGTWDEFCEILTWAQLGIHRKPCAILNVNGYYDSLLQMADHALQEGFLHAANRNLILSGSDPADLLDRMAAYDVPVTDKWIGRSTR